MLEINDAVKRSVEQQRVDEILAALPAILRAAIGGRSRCQCRYVYAGIVDRFAWRATRAEWTRALRQVADQGLIDLKGTDDNDYVTIISR